MNMTPGAQSSLREQVAAEVRAQIARAGRTKAQVAREINKDPSVLSRQCSGRVAFSLDDLESIARVLDIPVARFFQDYSGQGGQYSVGLTGFDMTPPESALIAA